MARARTAEASARAGAWQTVASFSPSLSKISLSKISLSKISLSFGKLHPGNLSRWLPTGLLAAMIAVLIGAACTFLAREQERAVAAATSDLELMASVIADDIDLRMQAAPRMTPAQILRQVIPLRALARGQHVVLTDQTGKIVASYPSFRNSEPLAEEIGARQPLTIFAEKAGVIRVVLPSGCEILGTVRALRAPLGQVAIIHSMADVLCDWREVLYRILLLLGGTAASLLTLAGAYFWQATRAQRADKSCRNMRDRVDMVLSRGRCGLWDWDIANGRIEWSISMYRLLGMPPRKTPITVGEVSKLIHPSDSGLDEIERLVRLGHTSAIDHVFRLRNIDGGWVWLRAKAEIVIGEGHTKHLVGIAIDVTETMALEERSARADMRLRDAIETISEAFVVWDAENRLVMCNSKFQRFYDLADTAVLPGTPYAAVMECGTPPVVEAQVTLTTPQPMGARTFEAQLGDGRWLQVDERRTKDGGYVSVGTDITALKRHEEQLMESERRLMHSVIDLRKSRQELETQAQVLAELAEKYLEQKAHAENANRAKSDFLANMGHELRTPLNAILGFSEIMMMESYGDLGSPLYQEYCKDIHASGQYLLNVIADVLEMSRLEAGRVRLEKTDFAVDEAIDVAIGSVAAVAKANAIEIETDIDANTQLVADRVALEKVLTILLNNSVKYTPVGGKVTIRARTIQGALNLYVEDTGVGITSEAIARLGRPFEQSEKILKDGMRGSGLGLAIARSLIDLHGGTMRIKSKLDVGTLVLVHIPSRPQPRPKLLVAASSNQKVNRVPRFSLQSGARTAPKISRTA